MKPWFEQANACETQVRLIQCVGFGDGGLYESFSDWAWMDRLPLFSCPCTGIWHSCAPSTTRAGSGGNSSRDDYRSVGCCDSQCAGLHGKSSNRIHLQCHNGCSWLLRSTESLDWKV